MKSTLGFCCAALETPQMRAASAMKAGMGFMTVAGLWRELSLANHQFCVTSTRTKILSGITLPVTVAVTDTRSPDGAPRVKLTVVVPAPLVKPSSWKFTKSADHR